MQPPTAQCSNLHQTPSHGSRRTGHAAELLALLDVLQQQHAAERVLPRHRELRGVDARALRPIFEGRVDVYLGTLEIRSSNLSLQAHFRTLNPKLQMEATQTAHRSLAAARADRCRAPPARTLFPGAPAAASVGTSHCEVPSAELT